MSKLTNDPFESRQDINIAVSRLVAEKANYLTRHGVTQNVDTLDAKVGNRKNNRSSITTGHQKPSSCPMGQRRLDWAPVGHGPRYDDQTTVAPSGDAPQLQHSITFAAVQHTISSVSDYPEAASVCRCCTTTSDLLCPALHPTNSPLWPASCPGWLLSLEAKLQQCVSKDSGWIRRTD